MERRLWGSGIVIESSRRVTSVVGPRVSGDPQLGRSSMYCLTKDYKCKAKVGTVATVEDGAVCVVRRKPTKPEPEYWFEKIPTELVDMVRVRNCISFWGIFFGLCAAVGGVLMGARTIGDPSFDPADYYIPLVMSAVCLGNIFGCRRRKAVFCTREGQLSWVSEVLQFKTAAQHVLAISDWCAKHGVPCSIPSGIPQKRP